jgi:NDP-hexose 4-ketoreductase
MDDVVAATGARSSSRVVEQRERRARILVLGAGGFIGSHVARLVASAPASVEGIFVTGHRARPPRFPLRGRWLRSDLYDTSPRRALGRLLDQFWPDVVINCVGSTAGSYADMLRLNVGLVGDLVEAVAAGPPVHLVHLGSAAEYALAPSCAPTDENVGSQLLNWYAATKLAGTVLVREAAESGRISAAVLRVFDPVGAGAHASSLVGQALSAFHVALSTGCHEVTLGPLDRAGDFIDVRDIASAALAASRWRRSAGQPLVFDIGRGSPVLSRWLVRRLAAIAAFKGEVIEENGSEAAPAPLQCADITAARTTLGWAPHFLLSEALAEAWSASRGMSVAQLSVANGHIHETFDHLSVYPRLAHAQAPRTATLTETKKASPRWSVVPQ